MICALVAVNIFLKTLVLVLHVENSRMVDQLCKDFGMNFVYWRMAASTGVLVGMPQSV